MTFEKSIDRAYEQYLRRYPEKPTRIQATLDAVKCYVNEILPYPRGQQLSDEEYKRKTWNGLTYHTLPIALIRGEGKWKLIGPAGYYYADEWGD